MALLFDLLIALLYLICALIACAVVAGRVNIVGGAGTGSDSPVRDSLMLYSSMRLSLFWDDAELQQLEKKAANNYFWDVTVEMDDDGGKGGRKQRPHVRFALPRLAMTLLLGTAAFALVGTAVNFYALPKCYGRPLEMNGDESETEITNLAGAASLFSKCTTECLEELFELGKDEANTGEGEVHHGKPTLGKANGMSVPVALPSIGSYLTAIPVGAALAELGTNCGAQARERGCNVQSFAIVELLVTALLMTWLQICLVLVVRRVAKVHAKVASHEAVPQP